MMNKLFLALLLSSCTVHLAAMDRGGGASGDKPRIYVSRLRKPGGPPPPPPRPLKRFVPAGDMGMCEPVEMEMDSDEHKTADGSIAVFTPEQVGALFNAVERSVSVDVVRALINAVLPEHRVAFLATCDVRGRTVLDIAYENRNHDLVRAIGAYIPDLDEDEPMS